LNLLWAIGMDGGGTKTAAAAGPVGAAGVQRRAESGPCNIAAMETVDAATNIRHGIELLGIAANDVGSLCIGVAGYSAVAKRRQFQALLEAVYASAVIDIVPDYVAAHAGAFSLGSGVVVIAGTGSVAYGVNPVGETAISGGYGYLIDDAGSGYGLGRHALIAVAKYLDGITESERLAELVRRQTGLLTREALIAAVYGGALDRISVAALAPLVSNAASAGDSYAASLLMHAGGALARVAHSTISRLFSSSDTVQMAKIGSLWSSGAALNEVFDRSVRRAWPSVQIVGSPLSPEDGALNRALKASG
jgi:glucosamine kinase